MHAFTNTKIKTIIGRESVSQANLTRARKAGRGREPREGSWTSGSQTLRPHTSCLGNHTNLGCNLPYGLRGRCPHPHCQWAWDQVLVRVRRVTILSTCQWLPAPRGAKRKVLGIVPQVPARILSDISSQSLFKKCT